MEKIKERPYVIVTGGTRGIGKAISLQLLEKGFGVYALYKSDENEAEKFSKLESLFTKYLHVLKCDVTNQQDIEKLFEYIKLQQGNSVVGLVNNAGTFNKGITQSELIDIFKTNTFAPIILTEHFANYRRKLNNGDIGAVVNIGSTTGLKGPAGSSAYAGSKAALHRMVSLQAVEYAKEDILHINTILPGPIETDLLRSSPNNIHKMIEQTPTGRLTKSEEIAKIVGFLVDNRNYNIVGSEFVIDGGRISSY